MIGLLIALWLAQDLALPLPEPRQFLSEFRKNLHTDRLLLSQYTPAEIEKIRAKERREDDEIIDEVFVVYDVQFVARENVVGHPAIRTTFKPRPGYKPKNREGKILQHIAGTAWVSEADRQLVRIEAEAIDTISIGFGLLAKLQKGARIAA